MEQTTLDDSNASLPPTILTLASTLGSVSTTPLQIGSIFKSLKLVLEFLMGFSAVCFPHKDLLTRKKNLELDVCPKDTDAPA